jgi:hypothetical protein
LQTGAIVKLGPPSSIVLRPPVAQLEPIACKSLICRPLFGIRPDETMASKPSKGIASSVAILQVLIRYSKLILLCLNWNLLVYPSHSGIEEI